MAANSNNNTASTVIEGGRNIHKSVWEAAHAAGETTLTFAKWRTAEMADAKLVDQPTYKFDISAPVLVEVQLGELIGEEVVGEPIVENVPVVLSDTELKAQAAVVLVEEGLTNVAAAVVAATAATGTSKSKLAQAIFDAHLKIQIETGVPMVRKTVLGQFMQLTENGGAGLSKHGANTYYQNIRKARGLVADKA